MFPILRCTTHGGGEESKMRFEKSASLVTMTYPLSGVLPQKGIRNSLSKNRRMNHRQSWREGEAARDVLVENEPVQATS